MLLDSSPPPVITAEALPQVRDRLLQAGTIDRIDLPGLSGDRRPIIAGGVLVLEAAFQALGLQQLKVSKAAMREGILYDMLGRGSENDPRDASVTALTRRYGIDGEDHHHHLTPTNKTKTPRAADSLRRGGFVFCAYRLVSGNMQHHQPQRERDSHD